MVSSGVLDDGGEDEVENTSSEFVQVYKNSCAWREEEGVSRGLTCCGGRAEGPFVLKTFSLANISMAMPIKRLFSYEASGRHRAFHGAWLCIKFYNPFGGYLILPRKGAVGPRDGCIKSPPTLAFSKISLLSLWQKNLFGAKNSYLTSKSTRLSHLASPTFRSIRVK